jgi:hypothetical protein
LLTSSIALLPLSAAAQVVISEVAYDPAGSDDGREWIEVRNTGATTVDLSKWSFSDGGSTKHALSAPPKNGGKGSLAVPAGGFLILADDAPTFEVTYPAVADVADTTMNLKNPSAGSSLSVMLYDERKQLVDTFTYAGGTVAKNSGDTAQRFGNAIAASPPTPGTSNVRAPARTATAAAAKQAPAPPTSRASAKKDRTHAASRPVEQSSPEEEPTAPSATATPVLQAAAAGGAAPGASYWYAAALGLALAGAGAAYATSVLRQDEWEIEDVEETV